MSETSVQTYGLTARQGGVLRANFDHERSFWLSRDLHPMLDCASSPDDPPVFPAFHHVPSVATVTPRGLLREEFFGGILYDLDDHRHYMVDQVAYAVLDLCAQRPRPVDEIALALTRSFPRSDIESCLDVLVATGLISEPDASRGSIRRIPARDLSLAYLQAPLIVEIELTYGCFRKCRHCAYSAGPDVDVSRELDAATWATVLQKLASAGVAVAQLTGGDPLHRRDALEIVEAASDAGLSVYVRSDTAAMSVASIERLAAVRHLWHVGTSIDGADAAEHDWMRGAGAFRLLLQRLEKLAAAGIPVAAGATLHRRNAATVKDIGRVATDHGVRWFDIGFLAPVGRGVDMVDLVLDGDHIRRALADYLAGATEGIYTPSHAHYRRRIGRDGRFGDIEPVIEDLPYITEWPFSRMRVDPFGNTYTAGKLKGSDLASGCNVVDGDIAHIWDTSPNLVALRELGGGGRIHGLDYRLLQSEHEWSAPVTLRKER